MTQIETFETTRGAASLQDTVNAWLKEKGDGITIKQILQSESLAAYSVTHDTGGFRQTHDTEKLHVTITVVYEPN